MNETDWNLDAIYVSIDSDDFLNDFNSYSVVIENLNKFAINNFNNIQNASSKLVEYIKLYDEVSNLFKIGTYLSLKTAINSNDFESIKLLDVFETKSTDLAIANSLFMDFIKGIDDIEVLIDENETLKEYKYFLLESKLLSSYSLSEKEELLLEKMKTTGSSSFEKLRDNTISNILVDFNGKKIPFSELRNLAYDSDSKIRKDAFDAELKTSKTFETTISACLNSIKGEALTETSIRGYSSILDRTLIHSRMSNDTFNALMYSIKKALPSLQRYYTHKAKLLGHKNGLPFYDLFAPISASSFHFTYEDAKQIIIESFSSFNEELASFAKNAFDNGWIDVFPKEGKSDGAFCCGIHQIKESRILSNFTGSYTDVATIAHELGHAFHDDCLKNEKYLNSSYPMPIAETASIFCETILENAYLNKVSENEQITLLNDSISESLQVLVDIYSRFLFEDNLISSRSDGTLSPEQLCEMMKDAQIKAYGDGLDKDFLHPYMWLCKSHYYSADYNYYNFPYAFGLLFSKGLYSKYLESNDKEDFYNRYTTLLKSTGNNCLESVGETMNFDLRKPDFWQQSIDLIISDIDKFIDITSN